MADIDTSSYPKFQQTSPLDTVGKVMNLQNTMNQNRLFQQQFQTNKAVSDITKRAMRPDGTLDMEQLRDEISKNPNAAYGLQEVFKGAQGLQRGQIDIDTSQLENTQKHLQALAGYTGRLMKPGVTASDAIGTLSEALTNGVIKPDQFAKAYADLPRIPGTDKIDESKLPVWAEAETTKFMAEHDRLTYYNPQPQQVNTPQGTRFQRVPQAMGATPTDAGGFIPNVPGPTQQVWDEKTQQYRYVGMQPNGGMGGPQPQGPAGGGMGGQPPAQAAPNAFPPGTAAAPPLGAPEAAAGDAGVSIKMGEELTRRADQAPNNKALLGNLSTALDQFTSGPGADWKRVGKAMVNANSPLGNIFDPKTIQSQEEFVKQAVQLAQSQFQQLGGTGANAQLDSAMHTSPNESLSKMGNKGIIALLKGNEDAIQAKGRAWSDYAAAGGLKNYRQFSTEFNKNYDPRVFQAQYLSDADKKKMLSSMSQKDINTLVHSANYARQHGWIQ